MSTHPVRHCARSGGGSRSAQARTALVVAVFGLGLLVAAVPLASWVHQLTPSSLALFVIMVPFGIVGFVLAWRVPRNPIGPILLALAVAEIFTSDAGFYAERAFRLGDSGLPLARLAAFLTGGWVLFVVLIPLPIALFPEGRWPSGRWKRTTSVYLASAAILVGAVGWEYAGGSGARHVTVDSSGKLVTTGSGGASDVVHASLIVCVLIGLGWVIRQVLGWRGSSGVRRQQLKWLMSGGAVCLFGFVVLFAVGNSSSPVLQAVGNAGFCGIVALPVGLGVAVLGYRLYDIDRLISRTLSYAIVTGLLVGVFVGIVALTTDVLPFSSPVGVAASTLTAAALFNPLRLRVQRVVDRRFNRAHYDAEAVIAAFSAHLRDAVELEAVQTDLLVAVTAAMQPTHSSLWIRQQPSAAP